MSPGSASRMPATPRIAIVGSPTISPPSVSASSANVRVTMRGPFLSSAGGGRSRERVELLDHLSREVHGLVRVDDEPARRVQHQREPVIGGDLLDGGADL